MATTSLPSHMEGFLHPLGGPATGVYSFVNKPVGLLLGNVGQQRTVVGGLVGGGGRRSLQGGPTPTDTGIIIRRKRSAKRRVRRSAQVLRAVRSPQESETVTSPKVVIKHPSNTSQQKPAGRLSHRNQEKSQLEEKTVLVQDGLVGQNEAGLQHSLQKDKKEARTVTKESCTQTDNLPLRDQYTQVEEEEQQSRLARWLACRVLDESLREVIEEEEERSVRRREEEEEGRAFIGIKKGSFGKEETIGARKVKWSGNMW